MLIGISRQGFYKALKQKEPKKGFFYNKQADSGIANEVRKVIALRPTYGYKRVTAMLNRQTKPSRLNKKRIYRVMKKAGLLLPKAARVREKH